MKLIQVLTILATTASASLLRACTDTDMDGSCSAQNSPGMGMGMWNSYSWQSSANRCFKVCDGCDELESGCEDKSNGDLSFDKFLIFTQSGQGRARCC